MDDNIDKIIRKIKEIVVKYKSIVIILIVISIVIYVFNYINQDKDIQNIKSYYTSENTNQDNKNEDNEKIVIHIDGAINNPGVYTIDSKSRLDDLVKIAGGLTDDANSSNINLAQMLNDGQKIHIYSMDEEITEQLDEGDTSTSGKININTANIDGLKTLPGIGDSTAKKIISHRESNGKFDKIEDIQNVSGIGESKFNNIKEMICVK